MAVITRLTQFIGKDRTNEHFTDDEFIIAICEYPGDWDGTVERVEVTGDLFVTAGR